MTPILTLVVAVARNGIIGAGGTLPWKLSSDMARFKAATMGKPILMGRKTWDSLPKKPLPGRPNIVLSRDPNFRADGAWAYSDLEAALASARAMADEASADEICVIGGAQLYAALLPRADRIRLTEVDLSPEGDARFPALDPAEWIETERETVAPGPKDDAGFEVRVLERRI
jgi:dihydrofolate reductase